MRLWVAGPLGLAAWGLYVQAQASILSTASSGIAILWSLVGLGAVFVAAYLWKRWWLSGLAALAAGLVMWLAQGGPLHAAVGVTALFAALVSWWANRRYDWPLTPFQAFSTVAVLVMVSLSLSALLGTRGIPINNRTTLALVVLYLSTPPWEWAVVIVVLRQSRHLRAFIRANYRDRRFWTHLGGGFLTGLGMVALTAVIVSVESHGLKVHVRANNPFVFAPGLAQHRWLAAGLVGGGVMILAPLAEEALFRGILFGTLASRWGYWPGTLVSAAIFGLAHLDLSLLVPLGLAGLILNGLYHRTRSLVTSTAAHATLNIVSVLSALSAGGMLHL